MSVLSQKLLSVLEKPGFSHDALKRVAHECQEAMERNPAGRDPRDHVMLYVIEDFCFRTAASMEARQPITTQQHAQIEALVSPPLKAAIAKLSEPLTCDEKIAQIAALLKAGREFRMAEPTQQDTS